MGSDYRVAVIRQIVDIQVHEDIYVYMYADHDEVTSVSEFDTNRSNFQAAYPLQLVYAKRAKM